MAERNSPNQARSPSRQSARTSTPLNEPLAMLTVVPLDVVHAKNAAVQAPEMAERYQ